jgi:hypothetical protein
LIFTRGENKDIVVELHWDLLDPKKGHAIDCETVSRRAVTIKTQNSDIKTFSLPHAVWYLCMHLSYKACLDVRGLAELKRLALKMDESEWDYVIEWARESDTLDQLKLAFSVSESLFGKFLDRRTSQLLVPSRFIGTFIMSTYYPRGLVWDWAPFIAAHEIMVSFSLRHGIRNKMRYLYHLVFPDKETRYEVYLARRDETGDFKHSYIDGFFVLLKVIVSTLLLGLLIRSRIGGERMLDPARQQRGT